MSARRPIAPLGKAERDEALEALPAWSYDGDGGDGGGDGGAITRTFTFPDFSRAFAFMTRAAMVAERMDHHPEWTNVYGTVIVRLTTHECDGVSERDVAMAKVLDGFA